MNFFIVFYIQVHETYFSSVKIISKQINQPSLLTVINIIVIENIHNHKHEQTTPYGLFSSDFPLIFLYDL